VPAPSSQDGPCLIYNPCFFDRLLVMANRGKNSNGSQFFVSLRPCPHLAGKHVVFGRVVKGEQSHPLTPVALSRGPCTIREC